ncbi:MAG: DUF1036 domain-containing protein [Rhodomicrobium sp.]
MFPKRQKIYRDLRSFILRTGPLLPLWAGSLLTVLLPGTARAEVFYSDSKLEISGVGSRTSRSCTVLLKPSLTQGEDLAPRVMLVTSGAALSFGVDKSAQYSSLTIVQHNMRRPILASATGSLSEFRNSEVGKALKSGQLFFVTGQLSAGGRFVSSRYEGVDFDAILSRIESNCPFDAESLMSDVSPRRSAERALALSAADLRLIRWALNKKYGGAKEAPEPRFALTDLDRAYLKRYNGENGFPLSEYLTAETARRLTVEGQQIALSTAPITAPERRERPATPPSDEFTFKICNNSAVSVALALKHRLSSEEDRYVVEGWKIIERKHCTAFNYPKGWFYFYGEQHDSGKLFWAGKQAKFCVTYPGPFYRVQDRSAKYTCPPRQLKGFFGVFIRPDMDRYEFALNP